MYSRNITTYQGPWVSAQAIANPQTEQDASSMNRIAEDGAQMTRTAARAIVSFDTTATAGPIAVSVADAASVWGEDAGVQPTISKTATGTYVVTWATSYPDGLAGTIANAESETEEVGFRFFLGGKVRGSTCGSVQADIASNVVTVYVFNAAGSLSDLSGGVRVEVMLR